MHGLRHSADLMEKCRGTDISMVRVQFDETMISSHRGGCRGESGVSSDNVGEDPYPEAGGSADLGDLVACLAR